MKILSSATNLVLALTLILGIVGGVFLSVFGPFRDFLDPRGTGEITSSRTIVQGIKPLGQLVSINAQVAKVGVEVNIRRGIGNVCYFWGIHAVQGEIGAGIDMTKIEEGDVTYDDASDTYHITLPSPQLTSCSIDPVQTQQYERGGATPLCRIDWDEVRRLASYVALREFRDDAIEGGILDRAMQQTDVVLTNFVQAFTDGNVVITYRENEGVTYPSSCDPEPPGKWQYSEQDQRWVEQ